MSVEKDDFAALMERARIGDAPALDQLIRQYEPKIRMVARMILGPALRPFLDSIDLVQSVHHTVLLGLRQQKFAFDTPENLISLALTLLRRKVSRNWRHLQRQKRLQGDSESVDCVELFASLACPQNDPAQMAQINDQLRLIFKQLAPIDRQLLELRMLGYDSEEIGSQLELSSANIRVRMTRLRHQLRDAGYLDDWF